ncbi:MAG: hypothetical protein KDB26_13125 [Microthrixaceae bacterium]|nr:hypothetical protein [Microthrixaceae bacterium]
MGRPRFRYSPWDGTQSGFELDAFDVMEQITDDLLYNGDLASAIRRMMQNGFQDRNGQRVSGVRDILQKLREERERRLEQFNLGGVYDEISNELREVIQTERDELDRHIADSESSDGGSDRSGELTRSSATAKQFELDMLPPDLAGKMKRLEHYEFESAEAAERFAELAQRLREQVMQSYLKDVTDAVENMSPEGLARMKDMMAELNEMLEARQRGEAPDFEGFMGRYGDMFPENPQSLDELLEVMARRMAAAQAMFNSMTREQRDQMRQLADQLLDDMDLQWQMDRLGENLRQMFPGAGWGASYSFEGTDPLDMASASSLMGELGDLDQLEELLHGASDPGALADVDFDQVRRMLGDEAASALERVSQISQDLKEAGLVEQRDGKMELTPKGMRRLGQNALAELFRKLDKDLLGKHDIDSKGFGHERSFQTRPYQWGDSFDINLERTIRNAVMRGEGSPVHLSPDDFEIEETENMVRSATVLMLDLSMSMPMRDNYLPAKKVTMALHSLISMQYPSDYLGLVVFSESARVITAEELPEVTWDYVYGTNMQHGFQLARQLLRTQSGNKQIIMITDGEPTAHINRFGVPEFHYPPVQETVDATMLEVSRCTRDQIRINTFMLEPDPSLQHFIEVLTRVNGGRAFFTTPETLGDYLLVDFIEQRRTMVRGRR